MRRIEALEALLPSTADVPVVVTCAATTRELAGIADRPNNFYLLDSMGLAVSVATGLAIGLQRTQIPRVVALEGDGSLLMNPNALVTLGFLEPEKLVVVLLDNGVYGSTADVPTYTAKVDLAAVARALGAVVADVADRRALEESMDRAFRDPGPHFIRVRIAPGNSPGPRYLEDPVAIKVRFEAWLRERVRQ